MLCIFTVLRLGVSVVCEFFFKPQCIKAADVELFNKLQFVLYTLWRTKPVIHIPFIVAVLII